jgi:hypothetical protein
MAEGHPRSQRASRVAGRQLLTLLLEAAGVTDPVAALDGKRVTVNERRTSGLSARADPLQDTIALDGQPLTLPFCNYLVLNKPYGVLSQFTDSDRSHATLADYVPVSEVAAVGWLDWDSEGLLLLTDDGWRRCVLASSSRAVARVRPKLRCWPKSLICRIALCPCATERTCPPHGCAWR